MADSRRLVKVFLASPGDLTEERKAAKTVVTDFNDLWAEEFGYQVELVGWEDTVAVFGRPQEMINRDLDRCELFVGLMWRRWGTPPDNVGKHTSGFEEEYSRSVQRRLTEGRPEISLFFKEIDPELLRDPGADLKKVLAFKEQLISEKRIYFENFNDCRDFEKKLMRCLSSFVKHLRIEEQATLPEETQVSSNEGEQQQNRPASNAVETPLSLEGADFLRHFVAKTEGRTGEAVEAVDIARFRLLTSIVGAQGNDEVFLGTHDTNLIFFKGGNFNLGRSELHGLISTGLQNFLHENVPLWQWIHGVNGFDDITLFLHTLSAPAQKQINTFAALQLILQPIPKTERWIANLFPSSWFHDNTPVPVRLAALKYLAACGTPSDLDTIRGEIDRKDNQTLPAAANAFISISLRESREGAFEHLYELQPGSVDDKLLAALFSNPATLSTEVLLRGASHQSPAVRRKVISLLCERTALPINLAEELLSDTEATVRHSALSYLVDHERVYSDDEAKNILVKPTATGIARGLIGSDPHGEACFKKFLKQRQRALKYKELEAAAAKDSIVDNDAYFILVQRSFKRLGDSLRSSIDNNFETEVSAWLSQFAGHPNYEKAKELEGFIRKTLMRKALDVIRERGDHCDLERIRRLLKNGSIEYSVEDIQYLGKHGEWEDIKLVIDMLTRQIGERTLLTISAIDQTKAKYAAQAIYALGRQRVVDLLGIEKPKELLVLVLKEIHDKVFAQLSDSYIESLLRSEDESVRKTTALKAIKSLPKKRLEKLFRQYLAGASPLHYNVIHWLDFGISVPRERAVSGAQRVLTGEWNH
ncbi:hypothetical protein GEOBRER4_n1991 [Citrifermentans bremense]|uniref:DUF4062 domain-containing protein n=1 Tax=Citrifermentans bremense TaxID=60035 RepID=A0A6S6M5L1_9BACT|nr:DUF4062 domain-containing protein [Citrifermentans bremense]BCG47166.1 hypothetical protein GEOBRER4_n1991 [Citrifermentans bremense]